MASVGDPSGVGRGTGTEGSKGFTKEAAATQLLRL